MKSKFQFIVVLTLLILGTGFKNDVYAQSVTQQQVENKQFTFIATSVMPLRGPNKFLNDSYYVRISKDSLVSDLPYFGVAQSAPLNADDAGIKITSTNFTYSIEKGKKDSWNVHIKFNDQSNTRDFSFIVFDNGNANLDVTSTSRDAISFKGYLKK